MCECVCHIISYNYAKSIHSFNTCMYLVPVQLHVHVCSLYLYVPEPWLQLIHSFIAILQSKQSKVERPSRIETLVSCMVDVLMKRKV